VQPAPDRRPALALGGAIVCLLIFIGIASRGDGPFDVRGELSAPVCEGGYAIEYAPVTVYNENQKVIATSSTTGNTSISDCTVSFSVEVPREYAYEFRVGTHGGPVYTYDELKSQDFELSLTLD